MLPAVVTNDLRLVVGNEAVRLTPTEGFRLAERLIRRSTARMVEEEGRPWRSAECQTRLAGGALMPGFRFYQKGSC